MAEIKIKQFELDNTIHLKCTFYNIRGAEVDVTSPAYSIKDSGGVEVDSGTPTKSATGTYYVYYKPTSEGKYLVEFSGTIDSESVLGRSVFEVTETNTD